MSADWWRAARERVRRELIYACQAGHEQLFRGAAVDGERLCGRGGCNTMAGWVMRVDLERVQRELQLEDRVAALERRLNGSERAPDGGGCPWPRCILPAGHEGLHVHIADRGEQPEGGAR